MGYSKNVSMMALSTFLLVGLSGCARYKSLPLPKLKGASASRFHAQSVNFSYRVFDKVDCKKYLDRDTIAQGFQPVQISITNSLPRKVYFSKNNISLSTADPATVASTVHTSTAGRAVGYGVASLFVWPFAIPAIVDGIGSAEANEKLDIDFSAKALQDQVIEPYETINGLIFVPVGEFKNNFNITLSDVDNKRPITLSSNNSYAEIQYA